MSGEALLAVEGLRVEVGRPPHIVQAVRNASFTIPEGIRMGLVGESGSGKSMTALSILRVLPTTARVASGTIYYRGRNLLALDELAVQQLRGREISIVFQNAAAALNPLFPVGQQVGDVYRFHTNATPKEAWRQAITLFDAMGLPEPERTARAYPHQLSGGMAQRIMIAMALICSPRLLIADEPTTGLDPTIQAQVLDLIDEQVRKSGTSLLLISHDIGVITSLCNEVAVMHRGEIVEVNAVDTVISTPTHPYTRELLAASQIRQQSPPLAY